MKEILPPDIDPAGTRQDIVLIGVKREISDGAQEDTL